MPVLHLLSGYENNDGGGKEYLRNVKEDENIKWKKFGRSSNASKLELLNLSNHLKSRNFKSQKNENMQNNSEQKLFCTILFMRVYFLLQLSQY